MLSRRKLIQPMNNAGLLSDASGSLRKEKYTRIRLRNPVTVDDPEQGKYTTYEIHLETNDIAFSLPKTSVRRRFSEFDWLVCSLKANHAVQCPRLPPKRWLRFSGRGRFHSSVIESRRHRLESLLNHIVSELQYLSDPSVHLFLQTDLNIEQMEKILSGRGEKTVLEAILSPANQERTGGDRFRLPVDRTKHGTFTYVDDDVIGQVSGVGDDHDDDVGVVIHMPRDVDSDVTTRVIDDDDVGADDVDDVAMARRANSASSTGSESDYLSSSYDTMRTSNVSRRRVSFKQDMSVADLIEHLTNDA